MRKFALYTKDKKEHIDLSSQILAAQPSGLGNNFAVSYRESSKKKSISNIKPDFEAITLNLYFNTDSTSGYANYKKLMAFLAKCGTDEFLFEYFDGLTRKYCSVVLTSAPKSEINEDGEFVEAFTFDRLTYWFEEFEETFSLTSANLDMQFPIGFPFEFSGKVFINEFSIKNDFFEPSPIDITVSGKIENNINIFIEDKTTGLRFGEIALATNSDENTVIHINSTAKKITVTDANGQRNGYRLTDKTKQSFLYLPKGDYVISSNLTQEDEGEIGISVRRYLYD